MKITEIRRGLVAVALGAIVVGAALSPAEAEAQRRRVVVRHAPRTSVFLGVGVRPYYYRPWFYDPWLPYYGYPYGWYPPYYGGRYDGSASLRIQVEPKETEVFVDGYWAGRVDDFDGVFQRLHLEPAEHEVLLYLDGHRPYRQKVYLQPGGTLKIKHTMEALGAGEKAEPRPDPPTPPPGNRRSDRYGPRNYERREPRERPERPEPPERSDAASYGTLTIRVQPEDAEIRIDGETWEGPDASERLIVQLSEGEHRIEVRKDGFATYSTSVQVRRGETTPLNVSLARE